MGGIIRRSALLLGCLVLAGCATPPGADSHKEIGQNSAHGAVAALVWVPDHVKGTVWLQFERRNAQGAPTGIPVSVLLQNPTPPWRQPLPQRPGWRSYLLAFSTPPGGYLLSRWVAEFEGKGAAVSAVIGWPLDVAQGRLIHLGQLSLDIDAPAGSKVGYRVRTAEATASDAELVRRNLEAIRGFAWLAARWPAGTVASGAATMGGTSTLPINSSTSVYVR